jgi:hypothetical protein
MELQRRGRHARNGTPCRKYAIAGGTVCRIHGGTAPQVAAAAKLRLALAADAVAKRLVKLDSTNKRKTRT